MEEASSVPLDLSSPLIMHLKLRIFLQSMLFLHSTSLICYNFIFNCSKYFFNLSRGIFSLANELFRNMLFNFQMCRDSSYTIMFQFYFTYAMDWQLFCMILIYLACWDIFPKICHMVHLCEISLCSWKNVYSVFIKVECPQYINSVELIVFKFSICLLLFYLLFLSNVR